jgi:transposase-like protein
VAKPKRSYSEADKASALALLRSNAGNVKGTARQLNMPISTLRRWADGEHVNEGVAEKYHEKKRDLADVFEDIARTYAEQALGSVATSKGKDAVIAAATALDKLRLLRGEATDISEVRSSDAKRELADRLTKLTQRVPEAPGEPN